MSNVLTKKPIVLDTAGATSLVTDLQKLHSVLVIPSAVNWAFVLHDDAAGSKVVCEAFGADKASYQFFFPDHFPATGLYATTLTNCSLLVYTR